MRARHASVSITYAQANITSEVKEVCESCAWLDVAEGGSDSELGGLLDDLGWEFLAEHHRRQDLIRFRLTSGQNEYNGKSWICKGAKTDPTDKHCDIFPIPKSIMDGNINLVQNPGY